MRPVQRYWHARRMTRTKLPVYALLRREIDRWAPIAAAAIRSPS